MNHTESVDADLWPPGPTRPSESAREVESAEDRASQVGRFQHLRPSPELGRHRWFEAEDRWDGAAVSLVALDAVAPEPSRISALDAAARVDHAAVVRPRGLARIESGWVLVTDRVRGEPLDGLVARYGPVQSDGLIGFAADLFAGLAAVHRSGIAHGNIDGSHVVVDARDDVRIIGLGLAEIDPTSQVDQRADLQDLVRLIHDVAGASPLPGRLATVLDSVASGELVASSARDALLPPVDQAEIAAAQHAVRIVERLAPRPRWVRALAGLLVATALGGLVLVAMSLMDSKVTGGTPTAVPQVVGQPLRSAQLAVEQAGFDLDVQYQAEPDSVGLVLSQEPRAGVDAASGSRVVIVVATADPDISDAGTTVSDPPQPA